jgi:hypothetical protein
MKAKVKQVNGDVVEVEISNTVPMSEDQKLKAKNEDETLDIEGDVIAFNLTEKDQVNFQFKDKKVGDKIVRKSFIGKMHKLDASVAEVKGLGKIVK